MFLWRNALLAGSTLLLLCLAGPVQGEEYYFLLLFSTQKPTARPRYAHTFATFVRATGSGPCLESYDLSWHTISWLPEGFDYRLLALRSTPGHNFELHETICQSLARRERVSLWGPYQIQPWVYWSSVRQQALLESGQMRYKAVDIGYPSSRVADCMHAVNHVLFPERRNVIDPFYGELATAIVFRQYRPYLINECARHGWLISRLGLSSYPIVYR